MLSILDLPLEVRDSIWYLAFQHWWGTSHHWEPPLQQELQARPIPAFTSVQEGILGRPLHVLHIDKATDVPTKAPPDAPVALLRTCQQINREATPYLFQIPYFGFSGPHEGLAWLNKIGDQNSRRIRNVVLSSATFSWKEKDLGVPLASNAWATMLQLMPNIRRVAFRNMSNSPSWCEMAYRTANTALAKAIADLDKVERLSYSGLSYRRYCDLEILKNKPCLREIQFTEIPAKRNSNSDHFLDDLPSLETLRTQELFRPDLAPNLPKLMSLGLVYFDASESATASMAEKYSRTLRCLCIASLGRPRGDRVLDNMQWMLSKLPNLTSFELSDIDGIESSILSAVPSGIKSLTISVGASNPSQIAVDLLSMRSRCKSLASLDFEIPLQDTFGQSSCLTLREWIPLHRALDQIRATGVRVLARGCLIDYNLYIHGEHIDQSGLIP